MQARIILPMTYCMSIGTLIPMIQKGKPGRRPAVPSEYQGVLKLRVRKIRGQRSLKDMASLLTKLMGRKVPWDTYRKWESESMLPHDAILPICEIGATRPEDLLSPPTDEERQELKKSDVPEGIGNKKTSSVKQVRLGS